MSEYETAIACVEAMKKGVKYTLHTDSKLIVGQVVGGWKVNKSHLIPYVERMKQLLKVKDVILTHVSRVEIVRVLGH
jgi:ribonuclease HI